MTITTGYYEKEILYGEDVSILFVDAFVDVKEDEGKFSMN